MREQATIDAGPLKGEESDYFKIDTEEHQHAHDSAALPDALWLFWLPDACAWNFMAKAGLMRSAGVTWQVIQGR